MRDVQVFVVDKLKNHYHFYHRKNIHDGRIKKYLITEYLHPNNIYEKAIFVI